MSSRSSPLQDGCDIKISTFLCPNTSSALSNPPSASFTLVLLYSYLSTWQEACLSFLNPHLRYTHSQTSFFILLMCPYHPNVLFLPFHHSTFYSTFTHTHAKFIIDVALLLPSSLVTPSAPTSCLKGTCREGLDNSYSKTDMYNFGAVGEA